MSMHAIYLEHLTKEIGIKQGKYLVAFAVIGQFVGYLCIKKIVKIKV